MTDERQQRSDEEQSTTKWPNVGRREFLGGVGAAVAGGALVAGGVASTTASTASYETVTVSSGETLNMAVDGDTTKENILYDVTASDAGVGFRLYDNATLRNIGIKGKNQLDKHVFRAGSGIENITFDRVYTECFDTDYRKPGGFIFTKNSGPGTINVRGATIKGWGNNGLYASKTDADLYVEDCYFVNNRTSNFRGGGNYHGNNRDAVFENCVCVIDDNMENVALYPGGGDRTVGFLARHGEIEVRNSDMWMKYRGDTNWYCMRTDDNTGDPVVRVYDSEVEPEEWTNGDVRYVRNVGDDPTDVAPSYAPTSAEDAANGYQEPVPIIDRFEVTEAGSANPNLNVMVEWDVQDPDANLERALVELVDQQGRVAASNETQITGGAHNGVDYFNINYADGRTFDVRLTVADAAGNSVYEETQVSE